MIVYESLFMLSSIRVIDNTVAERPFLASGNSEKLSSLSNSRQPPKSFISFVLEKQICAISKSRACFSSAVSLVTLRCLDEFTTATNCQDICLSRASFSFWVQFWSCSFPAKRVHSLIQLVISGRSSMLGWRCSPTDLQEDICNYSILTIAGFGVKGILKKFWCKPPALWVLSSWRLQFLLRGAVGARLSILSYFGDQKASPGDSGNFSHIFGLWSQISSSLGLFLFLAQSVSLSPGHFRAYNSSRSFNGFCFKN